MRKHRIFAVYRDAKKCRRSLKFDEGRDLFEKFRCLKLGQQFENRAKARNRKQC